MRKLAEEFYSLPSVHSPCPKSGPSNYIPMDLDRARLKDPSVFKSDESPDVMTPLGNSGFNDPKDALNITHVYYRVSYACNCFVKST